MKSTILTSLLATILFLLPDLLTAQNKTSCSQLDGVWEYDLPDARGMWFSKEGRYLWVVFPKERKTFAGESPTIEEEAEAFGEINVSTGTWKCEEQRATVTQLYIKNPAQAGQTFQFDFEVIGDKAKYWVLQADGSRGPEGNFHKIGDFGKPNKENCGTADGFWEYELPDQYGISALAGGYFGWILVEKAWWDGQTDWSTAEGKAAAFDKITTATGSYSCDQQGRPHWKNLHAKDYRVEGQSFATENELQGGNIQFWFLDAEGKRNGGGGKAKRLK